MPLRPLRSRLWRRLVSVFCGTAIIAGLVGIGVTAHASYALKFDPSCVSSITSQLERSNDTACLIVHGTIATLLPNADPTRKGSLLFRNSDGSVNRLEYVAADPAWTAVLRDGPGSPAYFETVDGLPHLFATATGTSPPLENFGERLFESGVCFALALIAGYSLVVRRPPVTPYERRSGNDGAIVSGSGS